MTIASCISPWRPSRSTIHAFRNSEITTIVLFRDVMKEPKRFNLCGKVETLYLHPLIGFIYRYDKERFFVAMPKIMRLIDRNLT